MYKSVILPLAKEDIRDAARWYDKKSPGLGKRFTAEVRDSVRYIKQIPTACSIRYDQVRTAVLRVFPFMIHYTINEANKSVIISAVLHTSRDPQEWEKK
jgi:plasmid stabilization system protein ParE